MSFLSQFFSLPSHLVKNLKDEGKSKMTKVQSESLPHILNKRDVLIKAQTGSGKTLTYALPILNSLGSREGDQKVNRTDGPYAIIICPTRELSLQSHDVIEKLSRKTFNWIVPGIVNGGLARKAEKKKLKKGINILVGTPGRIYDHMKMTENLYNFLAKIEFLIIDEADRLFEQTFEDQVREIILKIQAARDEKAAPLQTILLSATLSPGVETLAGLALKNPVTVDLGNDQLDADNYKSLEIQQFSIPKDLDQLVCFCPLKTKFIVLRTLIQQRLNNDEKTVIFFSTIEEVVFFSNVFINCKEVLDYDLKARSDKILALHGDMDQNVRNSVYNKFKLADKNYILFSTDVTERGLHFNNLKWIIQYNPAPTIRGYVHRVGRTARVGKSGKSIVLMSPSQEPYLKSLAASGTSVSIVQVTEIIDQLYSEKPYNLPTKKSQVKGGQKQIAKNKQQQLELASKIQKHYQDYINDEDNFKIKKQAVDTYQQFLRAYMTCRKELGFIAKDLHFGHLAKTFGLIDPPRELVKKVRDLAWAQKNGPKRPNGKDKHEKYGQENKPFYGHAETSSADEKASETEKMLEIPEPKGKEDHEKSKLHFPELQPKKQQIERSGKPKKCKSDGDNNNNSNDPNSNSGKNMRTITIDNEQRRAKAQKQINRAKIVEKAKFDEFSSGFLDRKSRINYAGKSNMAKRK